MMKQSVFIPVILPVMMVTGSYAQAWNIGGNVVNLPSADVLLGIASPNTKNLVFVNGNSGGVPVERGRITSGGLWGIGTQGPNSRFHLNAPAGTTTICW